VDCFQTFTNNGEHARDILFEANTCMDFHQGLMASNVEGTDTRRLTFRNNVFARGHAWGLCVHDVDEIVVENNTFYDIAHHGAGFRDDSVGNVVRNNIFMNVSSSYWASDGGEVAGDHNIIFNSNPPDTPGPNDMVDTDPLMVDPEGGDFTLTDGSPAIDTGLDIAEVAADHDGTPRPQGEGWDVGAFEHAETQRLAIVTTALPSGRVGSDYTGAIAAAGGQPPYIWSVFEGSLPPGLALDPQDGVVTGTPSEPGVTVLWVQATDSRSATAQKRYALAVDGASSGGGSGCGCRSVGGSRLGDSAPGGSPLGGLRLLGCLLAALLTFTLLSLRLGRADESTQRTE
jgi:hypothetical protein